MIAKGRLNINFAGCGDISGVLKESDIDISPAQVNLLSSGVKRIGSYTVEIDVDPNFSPAILKYDVQNYSPR